MQYLAQRPHRVEGGLIGLPRTVDEMFRQFWGGVPQTRPQQTTWQPAVDVTETPQAYLFRVEVPGINPDDIDITLSGDTLSIRGEKVVDHKGEDEAWRIAERTNGRFERHFTLPVPVAPDGIEAEARNGLLAIRVMKAKEAQPHKVQIRTS